MDMKYIKMFFLGLVFFSFISCDYDNNNGTLEPTIFKGSIIYSDSNEPFQGGSINISGVRNDFPVRQTIIGKFQRIASDGPFNLQFDGNDSIDRFIFSVFEPLEVDQTPTFNKVECGNMDCSRIEPGRVYDNLIIKLNQ